jgi:tetratricopeptide (TPR) repeat protein
MMPFIATRHNLLRAVPLSVWLLTAIGPVQACLNDRDITPLAQEARAFPAQQKAGEELPGLVEVITGRFPRNPPLYYEMRIRRAVAESKTAPDRLDLYDDIAVAYDRIGRSKDALLWIETKRVRLADTSPKDEQFKEHWYRYYANAGTFRAHQWLRSGANRSRLPEIKQARQEIAKAIEIKPDAHFGRETYQLQVMDWIITGGRRTQSEGARDLSRFIERVEGQPVADGLAGLIVLGNAWESVDIFIALARTLSSKYNSAKIAYLADLRAQELIHSGRRSLVADVTQYDQNKRRGYYTYHPAGTDRIKTKYTELRAAAERWQKDRTDYMMARLQAGKHPDTDPTFWHEWQPAPAPTLAMPWFPDFKESILRPSVLGPFFLMYLPMGIIATLYCVFVIRRLPNAKRERLRQQERNCSDLDIYR